MPYRSKSIYNYRRHSKRLWDLLNLSAAFLKTCAQEACIKMGALQQSNLEYIVLLIPEVFSYYLGSSGIFFLRLASESGNFSWVENGKNTLYVTEKICFGSNNEGFHSSEQQKYDGRFKKG
jgi:hypothetical protein